jgi:hypothetical protein
MTHHASILSKALLVHIHSSSIQIDSSTSKTKADGNQTENTLTTAAPTNPGYLIPYKKYGLTNGTPSLPRDTPT